MTTAYTFPYAGHTVDLDACHIEFSPFWSSERAERLGHKPDALQAILYADVIPEPGKKGWQAIVTTKHMDCRGAKAIATAKALLTTAVENERIELCRLALLTSK